MEVDEAKNTATSAFTSVVTAETDDPNALWNTQLESTSSFSPSNMASMPTSEIEIRELEQFANVLDRRISYLDSLQTLEQNWISGGADTPSAKVIMISKSLLYFIKNQAIYRSIRQAPRVVLGPLPSGGICIEMHSTSDNAIYVTLHNSESVELDVKYRGYYFSLDTDPSSIESKIISRYEAITE